MSKIITFFYHVKSIASFKDGRILYYETIAHKNISEKDLNSPALAAKEFSEFIKDLKKEIKEYLEEKFPYLAKEISSIEIELYKLN